MRLLTDAFELIERLLELIPGERRHEIRDELESWRSDIAAAAPDPGLIEVARRLHAEASGDLIEIDDDAPTSRGEDGAFVGAWVWIGNDDLPGGDTSD